MQQTISTLWQDREDLGPNAIHALQNIWPEFFEALESGDIRVMETDGTFHAWVKQGILLYFKTTPMTVMSDHLSNYYDKVPLRFANTTEAEFKALGIRVVPQALVRRGAHVGRGTVLMPSYVNIGAYIDEGCMIDTWATVGSCAQIGKHVHISGGAGIGGVLEPLQAEPCVIEDNCFIGARSEIVEGVRIGHDSVIAMGTFIGQSTKILNRSTGEISYGEVPPGSVVVPGSIPDSRSSALLSCAVIVKQVDNITKAKVALNEYLREDLAKNPA